MPGSVLASDGLDVKWSDISGKNILYVAPTGADTNPGTESLPYRTVQAACTAAKEASITEVENINGGTGGTSSVYNNVRAVAYKELTVSGVPTSTSFEVTLGTSTYTHVYVSGGEIRKDDDTALTVTNAPYNNATGVITITTSGAHGLSISDKVRVRGLDYTCAIGAKTYPAVGEDSYFRVDTTGTIELSVTNGTAHHNNGDRLRIDGSLIGGATTVTADVKSIASDVIKVANGEYKEVLPLRVRPRVSLIGESLRNCRISPTTGKGTQIKTTKLTNNISGATDGEYKYVHPYKIEKTVAVVTAADAVTITVNIGTSNLVHNYVRGGLITNAAYGEIIISNAVYDNATGVVTISTTTNHGLSAADNIKLSGLQYTTTEGDKILPTVGIDAVFSVLVQSGVATEIITWNGGNGFGVGDVITLKSNDVGGGGNLTLTVG